MLLFLVFELFYVLILPTIDLLKEIIDKTKPMGARSKVHNFHITLER